MQLIDVTTFERQGNTEEDIHIANLEETRLAINEISEHALKTIQILTPDLEANIYDNETFISHLLNIARGNRHAQIQILAIDTSTAVQNGHGLIRLAQQLTSSIEIRIAPEEYQQIKTAFMLVDTKGFVFRTDSKRYKVLYNPDCKLRSQKLAEIFSTIWVHAERDQQTRRLNI